MLILKLSIGFWLICELCKYAGLFVTKKWIYFLYLGAETLMYASLFYFVYNAVVDLASGEVQIWNGLMEIASKVGAV